MTASDRPAPDCLRRLREARSRAFAAAGLLLILATGCAGPRVASPPVSTPPSPPPASPPAAAAEAPPASIPGSAPGAAGGPAAGAAAAWTLPPSELFTRRLYRVHYEGPEGEGGFRLTLELEAADRYRARAVDLLGRPLWSLSFQRSEGLWVDHRAEVYCRLTDRLDLDGLPLAPFPLTSLPPLLLGRLPEPPAPDVPPRLEGDELTLIDGAGRRWTAHLAAGGAAVERWSLRSAGDSSPPELSWLRPEGGRVILSDRVRGIQLRWHQVAAQPLTGPLVEAGVEPPPPTGYRRVGCGEAVY